MKFGDSIDSVRADNAQVGHVDPLLAVLLHQRHTSHPVHIAREEFSDLLGTRRK